jgi:hypothetical protein
MRRTRKNVICYTGIDSRKNGKHSITNFRKITRKLYSKSKCKEMKKFGYKSECPKNKNINGWVNFFGAEYTSPAKCNSIIKDNQS